MTLEQELEIQELLKNWRDERHLTLEMQRDGLMGNLCEEMAEYYRATNESEKIDALCDIYVFCMNSLDSDLKVTRDGFNKTDFPRIYVLNDCKMVLLSEIKDNLDKLKLEDIDVNYFNLYLYAMMKSAEIETTKLGYNFYECMLQTIKEISSRVGHYDENIHKFVKDKSEEAKAKWYKADYEKCKIKDNK